MKLSMVLAAKPADIARAVIVGMVRLGCCSALLTGLRIENANALGRFDIQVRQIPARVVPAPKLLTGERLGHRLPSTNPVRPSSESFCRT